MGWIGNIVVGLALSIGLIPNSISYVAPEPPPPLTVEEKILAELPPVFIEIARAESQMKPTAYNNEAHRGCRGSAGLFQIACVNYAGDIEDLYDVDLNIQIAKRVYETQGLKAWGVCTNGRVKCYD